MNKYDSSIQKNIRNQPARCEGINYNITTYSWKWSSNVQKMKGMRIVNQQMSRALATGDNTPVVLIGADGQAEVSITSVELIQLINEFRREEGNRVKSFS